jgi:hypothetical protein
MSNYPVGQLLNVYLQTTAGGAVRITGSQDGSITLTSVGDFAVFQVSPTSTSARAWRLVSSPAGILAARGLNKVTVTSNTSGDASPSVAELRAGVYELSTGTTATLTLPTGAVMLAGISGLTTGDSFDCLINNNNSGTCTLAAGASGSTLEGSIATIATTVCRLVRFVITNGSTGAYTAYVVV